MNDTVNVNVQEELVKQFAAYVAENERFAVKGVKASAARARKALQEVTKLAKLRRKEITEAKEAMAANK